jgi:hypothetical protein
VPPCPSLWADVCPPHDGRVYASVFVVILQCFPCTPAPCLAGSLGRCATLGPPTSGGGRLAHAGPREPDAPSALLPGRSHPHPPVHDHAAHSWHGRPHDARDGMPVAARPRAQRLASRRQHTTPAAACADQGRGVSVAACRLHSPASGAQEQGACGVACTSDKGGIWGDARQGIWGDAPGDLERRSRGFGETKNATTLGTAII